MKQSSMLAGTVRHEPRVELEPVNFIAMQKKISRLRNNKEAQSKAQTLYEVALKEKEEIDELLSEPSIEDNYNFIIVCITFIQRAKAALEALRVPSEKDQVTVHEILKEIEKFQTLKKRILSIRRAKEMEAGWEWRGRGLQVDQQRVRQDEEFYETLQDVLASIGELAKEERREPVLPTVFISYGWPTEANKPTENWVQPFLIELQQALQWSGLTVGLDKRGVSIGDDAYAFMRKVQEYDYTLLFCTPSLMDKYNDTKFHAVKIEMAKMIIKLNEDIDLIGTGRILPIALEGINGENYPDWFHLNKIVFDARKHSYVGNLKMLLGKVLSLDLSSKQFVDKWLPIKASPYAQRISEEECKEAMKEKSKSKKKGEEKKELDEVKIDVEQTVEEGKLIHAVKTSYRDEKTSEYATSVIRYFPKVVTSFPDEHLSVYESALFERIYHHVRKNPETAVTKASFRNLKNITGPIAYGNLISVMNSFAKDAEVDNIVSDGPSLLHCCEEVSKLETASQRFICDPNKLRRFLFFNHRSDVDITALKDYPSLEKMSDLDIAALMVSYAAKIRLQEQDTESEDSFEEGIQQINFLSSVEGKRLSSTNERTTSTCEEESGCSKIKNDKFRVRQAYLGYANLEKGYFKSMLFKRVIMRKANLSKATFEKVTFETVNMLGANIKGANFENIRFNRCRLKRVKFFDEARFIDIDSMNTRINVNGEGKELKRVVFERQAESNHVNIDSVIDEVPASASTNCILS